MDELGRAAVSIWKPKVTPMSELKPHEMSQVPYGEDGQPFVQKTSLEYTQPVRAALSFKLGSRVRKGKKC